MTQHEAADAMETKVTTKRKTVQKLYDIGIEDVEMIAALANVKPEYVRRVLKLDDTRSAARPQDEDVRECVWVGSRFDNWWYSGCNNRLELTNGKDPIANGFKFCSYCGGHLKATSDRRKLARVGGGERVGGEGDE